jgi:hypothetical protein
MAPGIENDRVKGWKVKALPLAIIASLVVVGSAAAHISATIYLTPGSCMTIGGSRVCAVSSKPKPAAAGLGSARSPFSITQTAKPNPVTAGETPTITISITIRNVGAQTETNVAVHDAGIPGCARRLGTLAPSVARTYTCVHRQTATPLHNDIVVTGFAK